MESHRPVQKISPCLVPLLFGAPIFLCTIINKLIINGLVSGKIYRKAPYVMGKLMVSCRFSLKPIHWDNINSNHPPQALPPTVKHFKDTQGCCLTFPLVPTPFLQIKSHCWWLNHHDIPLLHGLNCHMITIFLGSSPFGKTRSLWVAHPTNRKWVSTCYNPSDLHGVSRG